MDRKFTLSKFTSDIGGSCPFDREQILSTKAAQTARRCLGETFAPFGGSLGGLVDRDAVWRLAKEGPNEFADDRPQHWLVQLLPCFKHPFFVCLALAITQDVSSPDDLRPIAIGVMAAIRVGLRVGAATESPASLAALQARSWILRSVSLTRNWRRASPARSAIGPPPCRR